MMNLLNGAIYHLSTGLGSVISHAHSFVSAIGLGLGGTILKNILLALLDFIIKIIWVIEKFVLGIMEVLEFVVNEFLGIGSTMEDYLSFADKNDMTKTLVTTFRAIVAVALVLMIIFTIYAMIKQDFSDVTKDGGMSGKNSKGPIIKKLFLSIMSVLLLPFTMIIVIGAVNSVLTSFNNALKGESNCTIAGQVLATATYDTNKYRLYAEQNKRIPILIQAYNVEDYRPDEYQDMIYKIKSLSVQTRLKNTASNIAQNMTLSFKEAITFSNNKIAKSSAYADYYENFICTAEQYQVLADFVDYCELTNTNFYIKSVDDGDIDWKYVEQSVFNEEEKTLTITYRDASDLNDNGSTNDTYTMTYTSAFDVTSPVSDALKSISALLGLDEYKDMIYNEMERDPDSINVVRWANEKVSIHFSQNFNINKTSTWTVIDEILMYEYYHYSHANTLSKFSLDDLSYANRGKATLDASKIVYRDYYPDADAYSSEKEIYCVLINDSYYRVEPSELESDGYGNSYYVLSTVENFKFLDPSYTLISPTTFVSTLKFSSSRVSLNDPSTWQYQDQIIIYEFFKDLTYSNVFYGHSISDFSNSGSGVKVPVYRISTGTVDRGSGEGEIKAEGNSEFYILLNGTYYQVNQANNYNLNGGTGKFLEQVSKEGDEVIYGYTVTVDNGDDRFGISTVEDSDMEADSFIETSVPDFSYNFTETEAPELYLTFSSGFNYRDVDTWTFRDYFLFYFYIQYLYKSGMTLDTFKFANVSGTVGKSNSRGKFYLKVQKSLVGGETIYLDIEGINRISEQNMMNYLDVQETYNQNWFEIQDQLIFERIEDENVIFTNSEVETKEFSFSTGARFENVKEWTMEDFVLFYLDSQKIISIDKNIDNYTYTSVCYRGSSSLLNNYKLYSFGPAENRLFLNENYILSLGYNNIDEWLKTSLLNQIAQVLQKDSTGKVHQLLLEEFDAVTSVMSDESILSYLYSYSSIIDLIVNDYSQSVDQVGQDGIGIYNSVSPYTYINENFVLEDLSTWTNFDLVIYALTGYATGSYTNFVVDDGSGKRFIIGDYALSIESGSPFASNLSENPRISSFSPTGLLQTLTVDNANRYYDSNLRNDDFVQSRLYQVPKANFNMKRADNLTYTIQRDRPTVLDVLIAYFTGVTSSQNLYIYTDGTRDYLLLGERNDTYYFYQVDKSGMDSYANISTNALLTPTSTDSSPFTASGTYTSFESDGLTFTDAIIYTITGSTDSVTYNSYTSSYGNFIVVDGTIVLCDSNNRSITSVSNKNTLLQNLYNDFYRAYVVSSSAISKSWNINYAYTSPGNDASTWTPLNVILFNLNETISRSISAKISQSSNGSRYFFEFQNVDINGRQVTNVIDITSFFDFTISGNTINYEANATENKVLGLRIAMLYSSGSVTNFSGALSTAFSLSTKVQNSSNVKNNIIDRERCNNYTVYDGPAMVEDDFSTWNWVDIILNKYLGTSRDERQYTRYKDSKGRTYVGLTYTDGNGNVTTIYVDFGNLSKQLVTRVLSESVQFNPQSDMSLINLAYYSYTGQSSGVVNYIEINKGSSGSGTRKIYMIQGNGTVVFVSYDSASSFNFKSSEKTYSYTIEPGTGNYTNPNDWNIFDYLIKAANGNLDNFSETFSSKIYTFGGRQYFVVNNFYIDLTAILSGSLNSDDSNISRSIFEPFMKVIGNIEFTGSASQSTDDLKTFLKVEDRFITQYLVPSKTTPPGSDQESQDASQGIYWLRFSDDFDLSDYSTWTNADFVLYYLFVNGETSETTNFQDYVNQGYIPARIYYLQKFDQYGNATIKKVYKIGASNFNFGTGFGDAANLDSILSVSNIYNYDFINFDLWDVQYTRMLSNIVYLSAEDNGVSVEVSTSDTGDFAYKVTIDKKASDFSYDNFYYFKVDYSSSDYQSLTDVDQSIIDAINSSKDGDVDGFVKERFSFKLSEDFDINNIKNWSVTDFILMLEFGRENVENSIFSNVTFDELSEDYYIYKYIFSDIPNNKANASYYSEYIEVNGRFYCIDQKGTIIQTSSMIKLQSILGDDGYDFNLRVNSGTINFNLGERRVFDLPSSRNTLVYNNTLDDPNFDSAGTYYVGLDNSTSGFFLIDFDEFGTYKISPFVKEVNWVQKLMTDMQVTYPDLNWANLLATGDWLEALGDYNSAYASGQFVESGNSANISAQGMVLSEFLLSIASESVAGYANFEYSSVFDKETIKALMLSMVGEEAYNNLSMQADIFVEMFNVAFAQILDDIAEQRGFKIVDGEINNLTMNVYKSFLATVLLSSDLGEYLYTIATRVLSQYTIYESLAFASNDYSTYYSYINGKADENGNIVDAFNYGTFQQLVIYENSNLKSGSVPTFTFNFADVYRSLIDKNASEDTINRALNNKNTFKDVVNRLNNAYKAYYLERRGTTNEFSDRDSTRYSYMLHVYWAIRQNLYNRRVSQPIYLELYYKYICGELKRWDAMSDMSISASSSYIQNYSLYKTQLLLKSARFIMLYPRMYVPNIDIYFGDQTLFGYYEEIFFQGDLTAILEFYANLFTGDITVEVGTAVGRLYEIFKTSPVMIENYNKLFTNNPLNGLTDSLNAISEIAGSNGGDIDKWNRILDKRDALDSLISELSLILDLAVGERTINGSQKIQYSDNVYSDLMTYLQDLYDAYDSYISTQKIIDKIEKASITFTLAQYSSNYVESGFEFSINHQAYTLKTSVSAQRLAEYVYGGSFLNKFGVYAQYTNSKFDGIIKTSRVYDAESDSVKIKLSPFEELKKFSSNIADYTAKLYFLTNLSDLSENVSDSVLLTDYVNVSGKSIYGTGSTKTTLEYLILDHIINNEDLSDDTLLRLIFGDDTNTLASLGCTDDQILSLARYLDNTEPDCRDIKSKLVRYLEYIQTSSESSGRYGVYLASGGYNSAGYYCDGQDTASDRIHKVFVKVMSYLAMTTEQQKSNGEIGVDGEYIDFEDLNFKGFKRVVIKAIINYKKNETETGEDNAKRYLALFNLISGQFNYSYQNSLKQNISIGTTLPAINKLYDPETNLARYVDPTIGESSISDLFVKFGVDSSTKGTILKLCKIENRPIEELVGLEYNDLYKRTDGYYDEAKGDVFIVCTYDFETGKYIPFMATNHAFSGQFGQNSKYIEYLTKYPYRVYTNYYGSATNTPIAFPIVAKGVITADLKPTAIKIQDNVVKFYRTDITATTSVDETALSKLNVNSETTTVGYIKYVDQTAFGNVQAEKDSKTMFIGSSDIMSFINSDASVYYVQYTSTYNLGKADEFDALSVLDEFSAFFKMSLQMNFMLMLGFITLIPLLFRASGAVLRRVLDLIFLVLAGPLCISMNSLNPDDKDHKSYTTWKNYMIETLLNVIGLVISFNLYYIMISTTMNMTFVQEGDATMQKISLIGGLSFVTAPALNAFIRFIFIIVAANMIQTAANLLAGVVTSNKVSNALGSPLAGGENAIDSIVNLKNKMVGDLNKALTSIQDVVSGKIFIEAKNAAIESIPGVAIAREAKEKIGSARNFMKSAELYKKLRNKDMSRAQALMVARNYRLNYKREKQNQRQKRQQFAQGFYSKLGMKADFGGKNK